MLIGDNRTTANACERQLGFEDEALPDQKRAVVEQVAESGPDRDDDCVNDPPALAAARGWVPVLTSQWKARLSSRSARLRRPRGRRLRTVSPSSR